jgi:D-galactarolactone cycloisomerase
MARIEAIALYDVVGTREAVVAPNAYAGIRPAEAREKLLLLLAQDGLRGATNWMLAEPESDSADISWLVGLEPRELFLWQGGKVIDRAPAYAEQLMAFPPLDVALLDLCAQEEKVPLWKLLGDEVRTTVPAYDSTLYFEDLIDAESSVEDVVKRALSALKRGHRALKIKVGRGLRWMPWPDCTERDIEVCHAVRKAVGPEVKLMVDANQGYRGYLEDAADFLAETMDCWFLFAEEMVAPEETNQLRTVLESRGLRVPLAGGEGVHRLTWCQEIWPHCRYDILQMDICHTGLIEYLKIAAFARDHGLQIAPHNFGSQLGVIESLHLGKVVPEYLLCECDDSRFEAYQCPGFALKDGHYTLPDTPGLGIVTTDPREPPSEHP